MSANFYYHVGAFPNSIPTARSDLYSGREYGNPELQAATSDGNSDSGNNQNLPPQPSKPGFYNTHSNGNGYSRPPQVPMNDRLRSSPSRTPNNKRDARDPATKPLVQSSHNAVPQPLTVQTPSSRLQQRKYQKLKRILRAGKILTHIITTLFSTIIFGLMVLTAVKYQTTNHDIRDGRTAWPKNSKTWPTYMLLVAAGSTLVLSLITLFSYCCAFGKASRSWKLTVVKYIIHIGVWLVVSTLYRYERSLHGVNNDLWGWSCSAKAAALQSQFNGVVNFSSLCSAQSRSWEFSIAEVVAKILFAVGHFVIYRKTRKGEKQNLADGVGGAGTDFLEDVL